MTLDNEVEFAQPLTEAQIFEQLDELMNAGRGEAMHNEIDFNVDYDAKTVLSFDEDEGVWLVNQYHIIGNRVDLEPMPMMTFAEGTL